MPDMSQTPWDQFTLDLDLDTKVSPNFTISELIKSETAQRHDIDNRFESVDHLRHAVYLARNVLQPVRETFGPLSPNSVYRSQALERALKRKPDSWISSSQHAFGQACDIEVYSLSTLEFATWVKDNLTFDQLILECYNPEKGRNAGWVHVSLKPPGSSQNRGQTLSYIKNAQNKWIYVDGLQETA